MKLDDEVSKYPLDEDWASIGGDIKYHKDKEGYNIFRDKEE